jgi:hypothetical protein
MIVLAEPVPEDMISAIGKAIKLLPKIDTYAMHVRVSYNLWGNSIEFFVLLVYSSFSWSDIF